MTTHHRWFQSGSHSLLAHLHIPEARLAPVGLVIVPPFGWEDICSYRPLRSLARNLAAEGIPTLRFDLPGTGDSSGSPLDRRLFSSWIESVMAAVAELKAATGVRSVSLLGIRLGATLALAAAAAGTPIESLILWGASASGRALIRELKAFRNMEVSEYAEGQAPPAQPIEGLEVAGFLLSPETESALEAFHASQLGPMPDQRVMLLSRDDFPHDNKLVQSLEKAACKVSLKAGLGYQAMMAAPHEPATFSAETQRVILEFLRNGVEPLSSDVIPSRTRVCGVPSRRDSQIVETALTHPYAGGSLFSVLAEPAVPLPESDWGLLFLNAGGVRHIGPNRMWVETARRWAARGVSSLRLDFERVGESDGDQHASVASLHGVDVVQQIDIAMSAMQSLKNCRRFIAVGLCSGGYAAFQSLIQKPAIRGAVLLNPKLFFWDPDAEARRLTRRVANGFGDVSYWRRLARGEIQSAKIKEAARVALQRLLSNGSATFRQRQIPAEAMAWAWGQIARFETRVTLVFADGEPLYQEMVEEGQLPPSNNPLIRCLRVGKAGHTFRALWAQQVVQDLIDREVELTMRGGGNLLISPSLTSPVSALA